MTPPLWQRGARPEELARVEAIDFELRLYADMTKHLARERALITGRALKRALYVPVKERRTCTRCGEPNPERLKRDGCEDPDCPEAAA